MTTNRAAKNAARIRAAQTGRSYTAARRENAASWRPFLLDFAAVDEALAGIVPFGVDDAGQMTSFDPATGSHLFITGPTGSGKSNVARIVTFATLARGGEVVIIDPEKAGVDYEFARPYVTEWATDPEHIQSTLEKVEARGEQTVTALRKHGVLDLSSLPDEIRPAPLVVILEDFSALRDIEQPTRGRIMATLGHIARKYRAAGISLVMVTQRADFTMMKDLPGGRDLTDNMHRLVLGGTQNIVLHSTLRNPHTAPAMDDPHPGDGLWEPLTAKRPGLVRVWWVDPKALAEALKQRLEPQVVTTTHLVPAYDEHSCWLRYTETCGDQTHETVVRDADVVARAHAGALATDELHRLTGSPLLVPVDPVVLDLGASQGLADDYPIGEVQQRIVPQLIGSVGTFSANGAIAGLWARTKDTLDTTSLAEKSDLDALRHAFMCDVQWGPVLLHYLTRSGVRQSIRIASGDELDTAMEQIQSSDIGLALWGPRFERYPTLAFACGDQWQITSCSSGVNVSEALCLQIPDQDDDDDDCYAHDAFKDADSMISFGRLPIPGQDVEVGRSVQVLGLNKWWWKVAARDERYIVLTRGNSRYGVIDLSWNITYNGVTPGPAMSSLDTLGGGWGDIEHPETILKALRTGQAEISHRRVVAVEGLVVRRKTPRTLADFASSRGYTEFIDVPGWFGFKNPKTGSLLRLGWGDVPEDVGNPNASDRYFFAVLDDRDRIVIDGKRAETGRGWSEIVADMNHRLDAVLLEQR